MAPAQCAGVLQNEGQLRGFLEEHIVQPLAAQATPAPPRASSPVPAAPATADGDVAALGEPSYTAILSCTCVWVRQPERCSKGLHMTAQAIGIAQGWSPLNLRLSTCSGGSVTEVASRGIVRPDSEPLGGLAQPVVLASVTVALAAVAVAWIVWSRGGRG